VRILLIEDNPGDALLVQSHLEDADASLHTEHVTTMKAAAEILSREPFDALLVDLSLPDTQGLETVRRTQPFGLPVVVMTGYGDEDTALKAVQAGAQDYLVKGRALGADILRALRYAVERDRLKRELSQARERAELLSALSEAVQGARSPLDIFSLTSSRIGSVLHLHGTSLWHQPDQHLRARWTTGHGADTLSPQIEARVNAALEHAKAHYDPSGFAVKPVSDAARQTIAALVVVRDPGAWSPEEQDLLKSAAGTLGLALERADLISRLETNNADLEVKTSMALETARLVSWEWDVDSGRVTMSPNAVDVLGCGVGESYTISGGLAYIHPDDLDQHQRTVKAALEARRSYRSTLRLWHTERKEYIWTEEYAVVRSAQPLAVSGVVQDINDRRLAQDALEASQERLELALSSAGMGTWDWQLESGEVQWGGNSAPIFGYPLSTTAVPLNELLNKSIHPEDRAHFQDALNRALEGEDLDVEFRVVWPDGGVHYVLSRGRAVRGDRGQNVSMTGTNVDLTQIKRAEVALRRVNETQKRFVGDAAHELRAPLTSIQGNLGLLRRFENMDPSERRAAVDDAYLEASRLGRLVSDMLALARGDAGEGLRREPLRFDEIVTDTLRRSQHLAAQHRLELEPFEQCMVEGDRDRLRQLVLILLENAFKYTPSGGLVRVSLTCTPDWLTLKVADSGVGIAEEDLPHVFERFYRADKSRTRGSDPGGTGLGLPIAQWVVAQHGGEIKLESTLGVGTTAVLRLPIMP
jgi:signal transduction histidine kinase/DNA-binding NarL/FixJ family response regulator